MHIESKKVQMKGKICGDLFVVKKNILQMFTLPKKKALNLIREKNV